AKPRQILISKQEWYEQQALAGGSGKREEQMTFDGFNTNQQDVIEDIFDDEDDAEAEESGYDELEDEADDEEPEYDEFEDEAEDEELEYDEFEDEAEDEDEYDEDEDDEAESGTVLPFNPTENKDDGIEPEDIETEYYEEELYSEFGLKNKPGKTDSSEDGYVEREYYDARDEASGGDEFDFLDDEDEDYIPTEIDDVFSDDDYRDSGDYDD
ncbi:MAG: hypothetical protein K6F64_02510, partial [Clostridia bacterium]|nr:hypothetical protein [Clostridia bacterium]